MPTTNQPLEESTSTLVSPDEQHLNAKDLLNTSSKASTGVSSGTVSAEEPSTPEPSVDESAIPVSIKCGWPHKAEGEDEELPVPGPKNGKPPGNGRPGWPHTDGPNGKKSSPVNNGGVSGSPHETGPEKSSGPVPRGPLPLGDPSKDDFAWLGGREPSPLGDPSKDDFAWLGGRDAAPKNKSGADKTSANVNGVSRLHENGPAPNSPLPCGDPSKDDCALLDHDKDTKNKHGSGLRENVLEKASGPVPNSPSPCGDPSKDDCALLDHDNDTTQANGNATASANGHGGSGLGENGLGKPSGPGPNSPSPCGDPSKDDCALLKRDDVITQASHDDAATKNETGDVSAQCGWPNRPTKPPAGGKHGPKPGTFHPEGQPPWGVKNLAAAANASLQTEGPEGQPPWGIKNLATEGPEGQPPWGSKGLAAAPAAHHDKQPAANGNGAQDA